MKHSTFIREWIEYTKFEIGISLNPFNFFQGKTVTQKKFDFVVSQFHTFTMGNGLPRTGNTRQCQ